VIVVDASALPEVLLQTNVAPGIERRFARAGGLHGPELLDLEILQALRRLVGARTISADRAELAVGALERVALRRWSHGVTRRRACALRAKLSAYDAAYVALAEQLRSPLVTCDGRLARSSGHLARIEVV
jgi:predicted nucleic acid-binding protein